jgi:hypothetical protein
LAGPKHEVGVTFDLVHSLAKYSILKGHGRWKVQKIGVGGVVEVASSPASGGILFITTKQSAAVALRIIALQAADGWSQPGTPSVV